MHESDSVTTPEGIPESDAEMFRGLRSLALQSISLLVKDAEAIQTNINTAKTKPKRDFYHKRLRKVKTKFQDEVARLVQIEHTMRDNNISFESPEKVQEETQNE